MCSVGIVEYVSGKKKGAGNCWMGLGECRCSDMFASRNNRTCHCQDGIKENIRIYVDPAIACTDAHNIYMWKKPQKQSNRGWSNTSQTEGGLISATLGTVDKKTS